MSTTHYVDHADPLTDIFGGFISRHEAARRAADATHARSMTDAEARRECGRFMAAFGQKQGAEWFCSGKTYEEAQTLYLANNGADKKQLANCGVTDGLARFAASVGSQIGK